VRYFKQQAGPGRTTKAEGLMSILTSIPKRNGRQILFVETMSLK
jgi:hypothetical protein